MLHGGSKEEAIKYHTLLKALDMNIRKSINNKNTTFTLERHLKEDKFLTQQLEIAAYTKIVHR